MKSLISLEALPSACRRTKDRIARHGPQFEERGVQKTFFAEGDWILLKSLKTEWTGWLPLDEIKEISGEIKEKTVIQDA